MLQEKKRIAIPIMTHPGIELCGATVYQAVTDGQKHFEAICALDSRYPAAAVTAIMDLTVEAEAFGAEVVFSENDIPNVVGRLVRDRASVEALQIPGLDRGRIGEYLKANRLTAGKITGKPVYGGCTGPYTLAGRLFDMSELLMASFLEPDTVTLLLEKCTQFVTMYLKAMKETGISGVILAEPAAGLISNEDCIRYSSEYVKRIVSEVQDENFHIILHNCGNTGHCTDAMIKSGAWGLHFGNRADMVKALEDCPRDMPVMGNIDPVAVIQQGTSQEVYDKTMALLEATSGFDNFVLSTGCDVPPHVPSCNIEAFYKSLEDFNQSQGL